MAEEGDLRVNGTDYDPNTLTFREQREMRRIIREELYAGQKVDEEDLSLADTFPAMIVVFTRRDGPGLSLDEALDMSPNDVIVTGEMAAENGGPPPTATGRVPVASAKRPKTPAPSGTPT